MTAELLRGLPERRLTKPVVLTIGSFDGVHRGQVRLVERTVRAARRLLGLAVAITFEPHPRGVLDPEHGPLMLTTTEQRFELLAAHGIDLVVVFHFTMAVSRWSAEQFLDRLLAAFDVCELVIGHDFALGHQRRGDAAFLTAAGVEHGFTVSTVLPVQSGTAPISSTRIRAALAGGDIRTANRLLGHPFFLDAVVVRGNQVGRRLGFPTANLDVPPGRALPAVGIYTGWVHVRGRWHGAAASIGFRPTFGGDRLTVEWHLLDFDEDIYDETVRAVVVSRLRDERMYRGEAALIAQMRRDVTATRGRLDGASPPVALTPSRARPVVG